MVCLKKALRLAAAALLALAGTLALLLVNTDLSTADCFLFFVRDVLNATAGHEAVAAVFSLLLFALYARFTFAPCAWRRGDRLKLCLLAAFFALTSSLGAVYRADDGVLAEFLSPYHLLLLAGKASGFFALFFTGMKAVLLSLPKAVKRVAFRPAPSRAAVRRSFWIAALCIGCAWAPSFVANFPGSVTADGGRALQQYFGEIAATADHPLAFTGLAGALVRFGAWVGGPLFGVFFYTLLQWLFLLGVMAWTVSELKREGFPTAFCATVGALFALQPASMQTGTAVIKDIPYSAAFVGYTLLYARAFLHTEEAWRSRRWWAGITVFSLMVLLLRHNGVLAVAPATAVLVFLFLRRLRRRGWARYGLLAAPLAALLLFNGLVVPKAAIPVESAPDVLGVSIQQTARILKTDPESVAGNDLAAVDRVLEADGLADAYVPRQSDSVRKLYRYFNGHTQADVRAFAATTLRLALARPLTAFHAFASLNGGYLDLFDATYSNGNSQIPQTSPKYPANLHFTLPAALTDLQTRLFSFEEAYRSLPLISQLKSVGLFTWAMLAAWFLVARTRERGLAWLLVPSLATLLACLLSAGFSIGTRYAYPMIFTLPYLLCVFARAVLNDAAGTENAVQQT